MHTHSPLHPSLADIHSVRSLHTLYPLNDYGYLLMKRSWCANFLLPIKKVVTISHAQRNDCIGASSEPIITIMDSPQMKRGAVK